jgi:hypothetical protein
MFILHVVAGFLSRTSVRQQNLKERKRDNHSVALRHALAMGLGAFLMAVPVGLVSQTVLEEITSLEISFLVLLGVIVIGVAFDIIGVAVTAAQEAPLHARAAHRVFGARRAADLVRNAHQVASFCNDIVGDVSGTVSGAIGMVIVFQIYYNATPLRLILSTTVMSAAIAGLIVGGKAYGKVFAIRKSTEIIFQVGRILTFVECLPKRLSARGFRR